MRDGLPCVRNPTLPLSPPSSSPPRLRWWWRRRVKHNENKSASEALQTWMVLKGTFLVFFCFVFCLVCFCFRSFFFIAFSAFLAPHHCLCASWGLHLPPLTCERGQRVRGRRRRMRNATPLHALCTTRSTVRVFVVLSRHSSVHAHTRLHLHAPGRGCGVE